MIGGEGVFFMRLRVWEGQQDREEREQERERCRCSTSILLTGFFLFGVWVCACVRKIGKGRDGEREREGRCGGRCMAVNKLLNTVKGTHTGAYIRL